ncbi:MAG: tetratricopeptide repeat protein [Sandaracinaceae bacterium]
MADDEREDESDLFSVNAYASGSAIPVIEKVPLTKEEVRRRRTLRVIYAVAAIATVAALIWAGLYWSHLSAVEEAVSQASRDGRVASIDAALALMESDTDAESMATKLRLRSMLVLAGGDLETEPIAAALSDLPVDDADVARERGIAGTYLALASGDLDAAMRSASGVEASGAQAAEAARARAMAARAVGNVEQALLAATIAMEAEPNSPRHAALFAELTARNGDPEAGLSRLEALSDADQNPASQIARARINDQQRVDIEQVAEQAQTVLDDDVATQHERAWARLLLARAAATEGDRVTARRLLDEANEVAPRGDELFTLGLTEAALRIGAPHLAREVAERLPTPLSVDAGRRAQLSAELALSAHDLRGAEAALRHAPEGARSALAQGRILQARGRIEEARRRYQDAAADAAYRVSATSQLASMELAVGNAEQAVTLAAPLLEESPTHPDVVPIAVEARVGLGQATQAMALVTPALEQHPGDPRLLAAKAHVQMALEQWEEALATLDEALRIESDDEDLHADRGRAAAHLSRLEVAREAYDRALELSPSHPQALEGRLALDVSESRLAAAREIADRLTEAEISTLQVERLHARLLVMEVKGAAGVEIVREALRTHPGDRELRMSLGWLLTQAEQYAQAVRHLARLISTIDGEAPDPEEGAPKASIDVTLARCLAQIRMRASAPARSVLENIVEDVEEERMEESTRAQLHAVLARLAWSEHDRPLAMREAERAIAVDESNTEAHLVLAETEADRGQDPTPHFQASLTGPHPHSRALASLALREEELTDAGCEYARRYRETAPNGQYARGAARVLRDCAERGE